MGEPNIACLKWLLNIFSLLIALSGLALIVLGGLFLSIFKHDFHFAQFSVQLVAIVFIVIGSILILLSAFGVFALKKTNRTLVLLHIFGLVAAFVALSVIGIWALIITHNGDLQKKTQQEIGESIAGFNETDTELLDTRETNWLQSKFKCCGLGSYSDWANKNITFIKYQISSASLDNMIARNQSTFDVPDSCCQNITENCGKEFPELDKININGCFEPFLQSLVYDMKILGGVACGLAGLTLIAIAFLIFIFLTLNGDYSALNQS